MPGRLSDDLDLVCKCTPVYDPPLVSRDSYSGSKQDWVAFMSQPYYVEVKVEVEVQIEAEVDLRLRL